MLETLPVTGRSLVAGTQNAAQVNQPWFLHCSSPMLHSLSSTLLCFLGWLSLRITFAMFGKEIGFSNTVMTLGGEQLKAFQYCCNFQLHQEGSERFGLQDQLITERQSCYPQCCMFLSTTDCFYLVQWLSPCLAGTGAIGTYLGYREHPCPSNGPHDEGSTFEQPKRRQDKCHRGS